MNFCAVKLQIVSSVSHDHEAWNRCEKAAEDIRKRSSVPEWAIVCSVHIKYGVICAGYLPIRYGVRRVFESAYLDFSG